jgi:predicted CoA-binding protein
MKTGNIINQDDKIKGLLENNKSIAILGLSPKPERDSYKVAKYLQEKGYRIIPVRPGQKEILGEKAYASLDNIKEPIDIVNVFRRSELIIPHAEEAVRKSPKPKVFWMQLNIENQEAADLLTSKGLDVVMNKCVKVEHGRLLG